MVTVQATACGRKAEASGSGVEAVQEGESLEAGWEVVPVLEVIRLRVDVVTPECVEDAKLQLREAKETGAMEVEKDLVPGVWREEEGQALTQEEKPRDGEVACAGIPPASGRSPLAALEALQLELEPVNKQASRAQCGLKRRLGERCKDYLEIRSTIIQDIRGFWATVVSFLM